MKSSPLPLRDVLEYLKLEDAEGLVPGSVKYVGHVTTKQVTKHYWSYPTDGGIRWARLHGESLGDAERVPASIRAATLPLKMHPKQRPPPPPKRTWVGSNRSLNALPKWIPTSQIDCADLCFVAIFQYDFDHAAKKFGAKPSTDKYSGGADPCRYFFVEIGRNKLARLDCEARHPDRINLYLPEREGLVWWHHYDQVMKPLGVKLEKAFRQGSLNFRHRKPTPEDAARTHEHFKRMWLPA
jgi:hypothetical protein